MGLECRVGCAYIISYSFNLFIGIYVHMPIPKMNNAIHNCPVN